MWRATFDLWPDLNPTVCSSCLPPSVSSPPTSPYLLFSSLSLSQAKVDNEIIDYRDLAAIPRVKAIYDIEHPDMISYKCVNGNSSTLDNKGNRQEKQSPAEVTSCATVQAHIWWHVCVIFLVWFSRLTTKVLSCLETGPSQQQSFNIITKYCKEMLNLQVHKTLSSRTYLVQVLLMEQNTQEYRLLSPFLKN